MDIKSRIEQINSEIKKHEYNYFVLDSPSISEYELESLKLELKKLKSDQKEKAPIYELSD